MIFWICQEAGWSTTDSWQIPQPCKTAHSIKGQLDSDRASAQLFSVITSIRCKILHVSIRSDAHDSHVSLCIADCPGGGQGIGRAFAHALGEAGAAVAVVDINAKTAQATAGELNGKGIRSIAVTADITKAKECQR